MTTTLTAIVDGYSTTIKALTPASNVTRLYDRVRPDADLEALANGDPTWIRRFDWTVGDAGDVPGMFSPTQCEREREVELIVAYPSAPRLYGVEPMSQQTVMEADLLQLSDALESPSHYQAGHNLTRVSATTFDEQQGYTLMRIACRIHYYETRSIG